jgi:hypothetical protein
VIVDADGKELEQRKVAHPSPSEIDFDRKSSKVNKDALD